MGSSFSMGAHTGTPERFTARGAEHRPEKHAWAAAAGYKLGQFGHRNHYGRSERRPGGLSCDCPEQSKFEEERCDRAGAASGTFAVANLSLTVSLWMGFGDPDATITGASVGQITSTTSDTFGGPRSGLVSARFMF